ncbi:MAG: chemotaxis protein CheW [Pseudomonadota bacterium]
MPLEHDVKTVPVQLFSTLSVAGQKYCIDIMRVRENRRWSPTTTLPHSPPFMMGTMNLRGEVIPIVDLACMFGLPPIVPTDRHVVVIVEHGNRIIGLAVEAVRRILSVEADQIREAPGARKECTMSCVCGLVTTDDGMIRIIDVEDVVKAMDEVL